MKELIDGIKDMILIVSADCIIVFLAMIVDLFSGLSKAKQRGEFTRSRLLRQSLNKFVTYEGGMLIAAGVDVLVYFCHVIEILNIPALTGVPIVTCILGIFLLLVEFLSVKEKADQKMKKDFERLEDVAMKLIKKEEFVEIIAEAINKSKNGK